jgi:hypothetical protein
VANEQKNNQPEEEDPKQKRAKIARAKTLFLFALGAVLFILALILKPKEAVPIVTCGEQPVSDGHCANGVVCINGAWECQSDPACAGGASWRPTEETCNGIDDDCDGNVDEGTALECVQGITILLVEDPYGAFAYARFPAHAEPANAPAAKPQNNDARRLAEYRAAAQKRKAEYEIERSAEHYGILCRITDHFPLCDDIVYRARRNDALGDAFFRANEYFGLTIHPVYGNNFSVKKNGEVYIGIEKTDADMIRFLEDLLTD